MTRQLIIVILDSANKTKVKQKMITAKKDKVKLIHPFISFVREGYDYDTELLYHYEDIDFTLDEYATIPRHKCCKCSLKVFKDLLSLCDVDWFDLGLESRMKDDNLAFVRKVNSCFDNLYKWQDLLLPYPEKFDLFLDGYRGL